MTKPSRTIDEVREFWNDNPLFVGEGKSLPGTKEWFIEFEKAVSHILVGEPGPIFTSGLDESSRTRRGMRTGFLGEIFFENRLFKCSACDLTPNAVELTRKSLDMFSLPKNVDIRVAKVRRGPAIR